MSLTLIEQLEEEIEKEIIKRQFQSMPPYACMKSCGVEDGLRRALYIAKSIKN